MQGKEREKSQDGLKLVHEAVKPQEASLTSHLLNLPPFPGQEGSRIATLLSPKAKPVTIRPQSAPARYAKASYTYRGRLRPSTGIASTRRSKSSIQDITCSSNHLLHAVSNNEEHDDGLDPCFADMFERNRLARDRAKDDVEKVSQHSLLGLYYDYVGQKTHSQYEFQPFSLRQGSGGNAQALPDGEIKKGKGGRRKSSLRPKNDDNDPAKNLRELLKAHEERRKSLPNVNTIIRRLSLERRNSKGLERTTSMGSESEDQGFDPLPGDADNTNEGGDVMPSQDQGEEGQLSPTAEGALSPTQSEVPPHEIPRKRVVSLIPEDSEDDDDQEGEDGGRADTYDEDDFEDRIIPGGTE